MPSGRPTKYKAEYVEQALKLCRLGSTNQDLADFFDVDVTTIDKWITTHKAFSGALKEGRDYADAHVADRLYNRAIGYTTKETKIATHEGKITDTLEVDKHYPPDTTACIFWLKNRQRQKWRDTQDVNHGMDDSLIERLNRGRDRASNKD